MTNPCYRDKPVSWKKKVRKDITRARWNVNGYPNNLLYWGSCYVEGKAVDRWKPKEAVLITHYINLHNEWTSSTGWWNMTFLLPCNQRSISSGKESLRGHFSYKNAIEKMRVMILVTTWRIQWCDQCHYVHLSQLNWALNRAGSSGEAKKKPVWEERLKWGLFQVCEVPCRASPSVTYANHKNHTSARALYHTTAAFGPHADWDTEQQQANNRSDGITDFYISVIEGLVRCIMVMNTRVYGCPGRKVKRFFRSRACYIEICYLPV